jgi:uncharacterized membrane protein
MSNSESALSATPPGQSKNRIHSIDIVRGLIMIIMTLDHVRDFLHFPNPSPTNMQTTTVLLFFTRWITHFCAPTFVFLSGVSAFLAGQRRSKNELTSFLLKRGLWLMLSDILIITLIFSFDPLYNIIVLEVLAAIGFGMILLALLIRTPLPFIAAIALIIIFGHNLMDYVVISKGTATATVANMFLTGAASVIPLGGKRMIIELYSFIPWSGALLLGYVFGSMYKNGYNTVKRKKILLISGLTLCALFIILRLVNQYGDPSHWMVQRNAAHTLLSFLNASKQPPSLLYMCMTLGPIMILLSLTEKLSGWIASILEVFGNVPYAYFIGHLIFIRLINLAGILVAGLPMKSTEFFVWQVDGFGYSLGTTYLLWVFVIVALYFPCKYYGQYKRTHKQWWLSYL